MPTFNFYTDIWFWPFFFAVVIIFRLFSVNLKIRNVFLLVASILMILSLPNFYISSLIFITAESLLTYYAGFFLIRNNSYLLKKPQRIALAISMISIVVSILFLFKYTIVQNLSRKLVLQHDIIPSQIIFVVGVSYFSFKMVHFVVECYRRQIESLSVVDFLNYIFFFPAFTSGPINRYNHFVGQLHAKLRQSLGSDLMGGSERIVHGLFKKLVLASIVFPYMSTYINRPVQEMGFAELVMGMYACTLYLYFDFAGYSDIAIGAARIMGVELPENFNNPFLKKNIQELWRSWHMSLTGWLTDYAYWPLCRRLRNVAYFAKRPVFLSNISIIITFLVCGMWHGEALNFVIWGLYHGLGLATLNVYQKQKRKVRNAFIRKYFHSVFSRGVGIVVTFHFFVFGILLFSFDVNKLRELFARVFG